MLYYAQTRPDDKSPWHTLSALMSPGEAAFYLRDEMGRNGFRFGELTLHQADLVAGYILYADSGRSFRIVSEVQANRQLHIERKS